MMLPGERHILVAIANLYSFLRVVSLFKFIGRI